MIRILFILILFLSPQLCHAQKQLSEAETQEFYKLIKQTKEYKTLKATADSINLEENEVPEEIKITILQKDQGAPADDYIFEAWVERKLVTIRMFAERYSFHYDQRKKQLVSVNNKPK